MPCRQIAGIHLGQQGSRSRLACNQGRGEGVHLPGEAQRDAVRVTIGDPRSWNIDQAQEEARRLQRLVDEGTDPREHAAEQRAVVATRKAEAERKNVTFADAWAAYLIELETKPSPKTKRPRSAQYIEYHRKLAAPGGGEKKRGKGLTS